MKKMTQKELAKFAKQYLKELLSDHGMTRKRFRNDPNLFVVSTSNGKTLHAPDPVDLTPREFKDYEDRLDEMARYLRTNIFALPEKLHEPFTGEELLSFQTEICKLVPECVCTRSYNECKQAMTRLLLVDTFCKCNVWYGGKRGVWWIMGQSLAEDLPSGHYFTRQIKNQELGGPDLPVSV